jgi:predicted  nucleic acid-binding Zn-ribbon protein
MRISNKEGGKMDKDIKDILVKEHGWNTAMNDVMELKKRIEELEKSNADLKNAIQRIEDKFISFVDILHPELRIIKEPQESEFTLERTLREFITHQNSYVIEDLVKTIRQLAIRKVEDVLSYENDRVQYLAKFKQTVKKALEDL